MNRFLPGLLVGLLLGAGGAYLGLSQPWAGSQSQATVEIDAGPKVVRKKKGKRKRGSRRTRRKVADDGTVVLSAADRKLRWKGDKVAMPKRTLDMGSAGQGRPLSTSEINDVIKNRSSSVVDCIGNAAGNAPLKSTITLKLLVDGRGKVTKSRVRAAAYLFDHGFYGCVRKAAARMSFPATGDHTVVTAPYDIF